MSKSMVMVMEKDLSMSGRGRYGLERLSLVITFFSPGRMKPLFSTSRSEQRKAPKILLCHGKKNAVQKRLSADLRCQRTNHTDASCTFISHPTLITLLVGQASKVFADRQEQLEQRTSTRRLSFSLPSSYHDRTRRSSLPSDRAGPSLLVNVPRQQLVVVDPNGTATRCYTSPSIDRRNLQAGRHRHCST